MCIQSFVATGLPLHTSTSLFYIFALRHLHEDAGKPKHGRVRVNNYSSAEVGIDQSTRHSDRFCSAALHLGMSVAVIFTT